MMDNLVFHFLSIVIKDYRPNPSLYSPVVATLVLNGAVVVITVTLGL